TASTLVGTNYLTSDKVNVGMVIYCTGFVTNTANNNRNLLVTNVTATVITFIPLDGIPLVAETATIAIKLRGKYTYCPPTAHTKDFFTVEVLDTAGATTVCRTFVDQMVDKVDLSFQANGMVTSDFGFMGKTEDPVLAAAYFSAATAATSSGNFSGATAILVVGGTANVICTGMSLSLNGGVKIDPVIGSKYATAASRSKITVSGQFSVFFADSTYLEYFRNETEQSIIFVATSVDGNLMSIHCPRIKITSASVNDGEINKVVSCNFDAIEYALDAAYINTTLMIQDSAAA
ncbi:MAG: phage tail tube protein, partial [Methylococcaceae bacterium]|nr:phage tail tube protein [Methylococcaceae bacterium]